MHAKRTTFPTEMKTGIHLEELNYSTEISTFLLLERSPIRKTSKFENADLERTNWQKRNFDALSCYRTKYTFIWRTGEHSNHKLQMNF